MHAMEIPDSAESSQQTMLALSAKDVPSPSKTQKSSQDTIHSTLPISSMAGETSTGTGSASGSPDAQLRSRRRGSDVVNGAIEKDAPVEEKHATKV